MKVDELRHEMGTLRTELEQSKASHSIYANSSQGAELMLEQERKRFSQIEEAYRETEAAAKQKAVELSSELGGELGALLQARGELASADWNQARESNLGQSELEKAAAAAETRARAAEANSEAMAAKAQAAREEECVVASQLREALAESAESASRLRDLEATLAKANPQAGEANLWKVPLRRRMNR